MVRVRHCLVFPFSSPFPFLFPVSSFTLPSLFLYSSFTLPCPSHFLFPFLFRFLFRSFSFPFPFFFLSLSFSFSFPFPFPFPFLFLSLSYFFLYYSFSFSLSFSLSSLMWIFWSRCEASTETIASGKTIWKGSGLLQTPIYPNITNLDEQSLKCV